MITIEEPNIITTASSLMNAIGTTEIINYNESTRIRTSKAKRITTSKTILTNNVISNSIHDKPEPIVIVIDDDIDSNDIKENKIVKENEIELTNRIDIVDNSNIANTNHHIDNLHDNSLPGVPTKKNINMVLSTVNLSKKNVKLATKKTKSTITKKSKCEIEFEKLSREDQILFIKSNIYILESPFNSKQQPLSSESNDNLAANSNNHMHTLYYNTNNHHPSQSNAGITTEKEETLDKQQQEVLKLRFELSKILSNEAELRAKEKKIRNQIKKLQRQITLALEPIRCTELPEQPVKPIQQVMNLIFPNDLQPLPSLDNTLGVEDNDHYHHQSENYRTRIQSSSSLTNTLWQLAHQSDSDTFDAIVFHKNVKCDKNKILSNYSQDFTGNETNLSIQESNTNDILVTDELLPLESAVPQNIPALASLEENISISAPYRRSLSELPLVLSSSITKDSPVLKAITSVLKEAHLPHTHKNILPPYSLHLDETRIACIDLTEDKSLEMSPIHEVAIDNIILNEIDNVPITEIEIDTDIQFSDPLMNIAGTNEAFLYTSFFSNTPPDCILHYNPSGESAQRNYNNTHNLPGDSAQQHYVTHDDYNQSYIYSDNNIICNDNISNMKEKESIFLSDTQSSEIKYHLSNISNSYSVINQQSQSQLHQYKENENEKSKTHEYDYKDNDYILSSSTSNKPSGTNIFLEHSISKEYSGFLSSGISFEENLKNETPITLFSPESESKDVILDNSLSSCHILESETEPDFNNMPIIEIRNIMLSYGLKIDTKAKMISILKAMWYQLHPITTTIPDSSSSNVISTTIMSSFQDTANNNMIEIMNSYELAEFIENKNDLYERILLYQSIEVEYLQVLLYNHGYKISKPKLLEYLDELNIFTSMASSSSSHDKNNVKTKNKRKRKE